jgi:hypothetical protein
MKVLSSLLESLPPPLDGDGERWGLARPRFLFIAEAIEVYIRTGLVS